MAVAFDRYAKLVMMPQARDGPPTGQGVAMAHGQRRHEAHVKPSRVDAFRERLAVGRDRARYRPAGAVLGHRPQRREQ